MPPGLDKTIKELLPEPLYIPAVKDLSDEIKTTESATFGRLLSIPLRAVETQLGGAENTFATLNAQLNRVERDGKMVDERLNEVKYIERTVELFVQENFPSVGLELRIPPPDVKTILSAATIWVNDGVESTIDTKGDGLKRAVTFAILRAYSTVSKRSGLDGIESTVPQPTGRYLFLFEEPELYLHPSAQIVLFNVLKQIATDHQVILCTHSPLFLTATGHGAFMKVVKRGTTGSSNPPCSQIIPIDLTELSAKDQFQLICFDNNNVALFSAAVVLVEGDSDHIALAHLARSLNPSWEFRHGRVAIAKVNGKGSIERYRNFFSRFGIRTFVITDLDAIVNGFDKLGLPEECQSWHSEFIKAIDQEIQNHNDSTRLKGDKVKETVASWNWQQKWEQFKAIARRVKGEGGAVTDDDLAVIDHLFEPEQRDRRLAALKNNPAVQALKKQFVDTIGEKDVFILEKGSIEDYYPNQVMGSDKITRAQAFGRILDHEDNPRRLWGDDQCAIDELEKILGRVFQAPEYVGDQVAEA